ncbi:MAG: DUF2232 domain-containing protein [Desulfuromonadales bacterium]|nr:DUF2232 domain-containing protein [Desulfuromonadales bacterium]
MQHRVFYVALGGVAGYMLYGGFAGFGVAAVVFNMLTPLPATYNGVRFGAEIGWLTVAATALLILLLDATGSVVLYLIQFGLPAGVLAWLLGRGLAWDRAVMVALGSLLAASLVGLLAYSLLEAEGPLQVAGAVIDREIGQATAIMDEAFRSSELPAKERQEIAVALQRMAEFMRDVYAGLAIVVSLFMLLGQVLLLSLLSFGRYTLPGPAFQDWKAPEPLVWPLILSGFTVFLVDGPLRLLAMNLLTITLPIYFLQGLAIIDSFFRRKNFSPLLRTAGYALLVLINPLPLLVACLGLFDLWVDFRKPKIPESS